MLNVSHIEQFLTLQRKLLHALALAYPNALASKFLLDLPKHGELMTVGDSWGFQKHGAGVRFLRNSDHVVVDVASLVTDPRAFDAWRITQYLASTGGTEIREAETEAMLATLEVDGYLAHDRQKRGIYRLAK